MQYNRAIAKGAHMRLPARDRAITRRQAEFLAFCIEWLLERHTVPTLRSICDHFGFRSTNGASDHIAALQAKGFLRRHPDSNGFLILRHPDGRPFEIAVK